MSAKVRNAIIVLIFGNFLVCIGMSLIFPVMPFIKNELHLSATDMGIMNSLFAFAQLIASPIVGQISDRIGRKPVLVWGLGLYMVSEILFAATNWLWMFDVSRTIGGLSAAMVVPTTNALAADLTTPRQRARVIGLLSAAFSGGLILGPGIGGFLAKIDYKTPFWSAAVLGLLSMISLQLMLPSEKEIEAIAKDNVMPPISKGPSKATWVQTKRLFSGPMKILFLLILISSFGLVGFESIYSLYVNEVFGFTIGNIALVLTLNGLLSLMFQALLFDRLVTWLSEKRLTRYCFFLAAAGTIWIILAHSKLEVIIATLIVFTSYDLIRPAITTLLTKASATGQGLINGVNMSLTSVGNIVGPIMSGALLDLNYHIPYVIVAGFLAASWLMTYLVKDHFKVNI
ncbi:MFS transporter [Lentilactobacillus farraginis]|uniref:MFS family major facilitator transporter n=1 Tax=Lentilactobacillus farraginis DSM 18382 = JCM 14108 TaxID=1423743 RepID=X0QHK4_9LACO|nr:MFS transporter [Lentilactobacillus farraginis]KRM05860.1 MFS family major facilitator transporter [Lentilactobacillus farraginis DSM 18382 = JCM 14108]GAF38080.1 permease [Lentilactobacillus farraginis DSM 18382 = JCM 14108]